LTSVCVTVRIVFVDTNDLEVSELSDNSYSEDHNKVEKEKEQKQKNIYEEIMKININNQENKMRNFPLKKKNANWFS
jgi:hypothetical protein